MGDFGHKYPNPGPPTGFSPWHTAYKLEKYNDGNLGHPPDEVIAFEGNLLMNLGLGVVTPWSHKWSNIPL